MIFVDQMGHMVSDSSESELIKFALAIDLRREWFQNKKSNHPHFDLTTARKRKQAVEAGARMIDVRETVRILERRKIMESDLAERLYFNAPAMIEACGIVEHESWSGWMNYLFSKCTENDDGSVTIPTWAAERWKRQASTSYTNLSEQEKESDRVEVRKYLAAIVSVITAMVPDDTENII